ncbi:CocE/NonD family hydrolase [Bradyrhizobium sp. USDA 4011]
MALVLSFATFARAQTADGVTEEGAYREYGYISMKDGGKIAYVVWRPIKAGQYPVVLQYSSYGISGMAFSAAKDLLKAGYAVVGADVRASGCSEGNNFLWHGPKEGPDGAQVVEWIGVQPWSNGSVGMFGISNPGLNQYYVAAERPAHLVHVVFCQKRDSQKGQFLIQTPCWNGGQHG